MFRFHTQLGRLPAACGAILASCVFGGGAAAAARPPETVIYEFQGCFNCAGDAYGPYSRLTNVGGTLYGTSESGGAFDSGTVFSVTTAGKETILHSFSTNRTDGRNPSSALVNVNGVLYGTTTDGGTNGGGTLFSITPAGIYNIVYSFPASLPGPYSPQGDLAYLDGAFYGVAGGGTAGNGGYYGTGAFYSVTTKGKGKLLYSFPSGPDSALGYGLTAYKGILYGSSSSGGAYGYGTVYSATTKGQIDILYSFTGGTDGANPESPLVESGGVLVGTTALGGGCSAFPKGCGTVYAIAPTGQYEQIYSFENPPDGTMPDSKLLNADGKLFGITSEGGGLSANYPLDQGSLFSVTPAGKEKILHVFGATGDGAFPDGGLVRIGGYLYGITRFGGINSQGTVFKIKLP